MLQLLTEEDEDLQEYQKKKENSLELLQPFFVEERFTDAPLPEPQPVAKWRMKQRVIKMTNEKNWQNTYLNLDENRERSAGALPQYWSRPARRHKDITLRAIRMLDR